MTTKQVRTANKIVSFLSAFLLVFNSFAPSFVYLSNLATPAYAEETVQTDPTPTDTPAPILTDIPVQTETPAPTDTVTPTPEVTSIPSPTVTLESTPSATPTEAITPVAASVEPDVTVTQSPDTSTNQSNDADTQPTSTPTPTLVPTITPEASPVVHGELSAIVIPNTDAESLSYDLSTDSPNQSATLTTDKADYAPTDTAILSGSNFTANQTYTLNITSSDEPSVNFNVDVITDATGSFNYAYQLDGTYRPNYQAYVKLGSTVIASVTFTDSRQVNTVTVDGGISTTVTSGASVEVEVNVTTDWFWFNDNDWESTSWRFGNSGSWSCVNHSDHTNDGTYSETFNITAPNSSGTYDLQVRAHSDDSCDDGDSGTQTLDDAVTVEDVQVTICHATGSSNNSYNQITVNDSAVNGSGGGDHNTSGHQNGEDIIPAGPWDTNGRNWDAEGQAIWNNACVVELPNLTVTKTNNVGGTIALGDNFVWSIVITNNGTADAVFNDWYDEILQDNLPDGADYSNLSYISSGLSNDDHDQIDCDLNGDDIDCDTDEYTVTLNPGDSITVSVDVTPTQAGTLTNPNGVCRVDPGTDIDESDEDDNDCQDSVEVTLSCGDSAFYEKSSDFADSLVNINFSNGDHNITVSADPGYSIVNVWLSVDDDGYSGYHLYATGPLTNFNPPGDDIYWARVEVVKADCGPTTGTITVHKNVLATDEITDVIDENTFAVTVDGETQDFSESSDAVFTVNPGDYTAVESSEDNYTFVSNSGEVTVTAGNNSDIYIVNKQNPVSISGYKYNADGVTGLAGWTITLSGDKSDSTITDASGFYEFLGLNTGLYTVTETLQTGWTNITSLSSAFDLSSPGATGAANFTNERDMGTINITKEIDGQGTVEGWQFDIEGSTEDTSDPWLTLTDSEGDTSTGLIKTGTYTLTENDRDGYHFVEAACYRIVGEGTIVVGEWDELSQTMTGIELGRNHTINCTFTNAQDPANIQITKTNDKSGVSLGSGDIINYTLQISNINDQENNVGPAYNVTVTDSGITSTYFEFLSSSVTPASTSPYIWNLGTINAGDAVTITYQLKVKSGATTGVYTNFAYADWDNGDESEDSIDTDSITDTVSSDIQIGNPNNLSASGNRSEGQVLGASTSVLGAATGSDTTWLLLSLLLMSSGLGLKIYNRKHEQN